MPSKKSNESKSTTSNDQNGDSATNHDVEGTGNSSTLHRVATTSRVIRHPTNRPFATFSRFAPCTSHRQTRGHPSQMNRIKLSLQDIIGWGEYFRAKDAECNGDNKDDEEDSTSDDASSDGEELYDDIEFTDMGFSSGGSESDGSEVGADKDKDCPPLPDSNVANTMYGDGAGQDEDAISEADLNTIRDFELEDVFDKEAKEKAEATAFAQHCASVCDIGAGRNTGNQALGPGQCQTDNSNGVDEAAAPTTEPRFVELDLEDIPIVPLKERMREWMRTPTPAASLGPIDAIVQEAELVRMHMTSAQQSEIEECSDCEITDLEIGYVCSVCEAKKPTRMIAPCAHLICVDCMTDMVMNRRLVGETVVAKECGVCRMAVGFFMRVRN